MAARGAKAGKDQCTWLAVCSASVALTNRRCAELPMPLGPGIKSRDDKGGWANAAPPHTWWHPGTCLSRRRPGNPGSLDGCTKRNGLMGLRVKIMNDEWGVAKRRQKKHIVIPDLIRNPIHVAAGWRCHWVPGSSPGTTKEGGGKSALQPKARSQRSPGNFKITSFPNFKPAAWQASSIRLRTCCSLRLRSIHHLLKNLSA